MDKDGIIKIDQQYHERDDKYIKGINKVYKYLAKYHDHKIVGIEKVPDHGPCLFALNHSLATYDIGIFQYKIYKEKGIFPRGFADNAFFKIPIIGKIAGKSGAVPGKHHVGEFLLKEKKDMVMVAPGGMRESLRPVTEKYQIKWDNRKGFVRLAIKANTPIILAACPKADDLYQVSESKITKLIYNKLKLPFPIVKNAGKGIMPKKIQLIHYLSGPYSPPAVDINDKEVFNAVVDDWHHFLVAEMNKLMKHGLEA
ncbi:MAG: lysophospholipid acyltransferase family protein [Chitinophagales bacterium]